MDRNIFLQRFGHLAQSPAGVKKLRDLILQLAVQGKLVEQDPDDEPAGSLLHRILEGRENLLRTKAIKKNRAFGRFPSEAPLFSIPSNWIASTLAALGTINPRNILEDDSEAGFVPMPLVSQEFGKHHAFETRKWSTIKKGYTHFANGDVGLAKITPCFENSKCCVFSGLPNGIGTGTTELHIFRDDQEILNPDFIYIFFKSPYFLEDGKKHMTGTAGQKRVPTEYFALKPFPLPPLSEQKRIVAKVDELMDFCDVLEVTQNTHQDLKRDCAASTLHHLAETTEKEEIKSNWSILHNNFNTWFDDLETVKNLRASILHLAMQGKLVEQDTDDEPANDLLVKIQTKKERLISNKTLKKQVPLPPANSPPTTLPSNWVWVRFGELFKSSDYGTSEKATATDLSGIPVYGMGHIQERKLLDRKFKYLSENSESLPNLLLKSKDLLFNRTNSFELVGKTALYLGEDDVKTFASYLIRVALFHEYTNCYFANLYLNSPICRKTQIEPEITKQTNQANFNGTKLKHIHFPLPPLAEQNRIVEKVDDLMELCDLLETQIKSSQDLNRDLLASLSHHMTAH